MVPDKPQKVEKFHFTWCGHIGFRTRYYVKGQLISKANYQAVNSSKKRTNEFVFTTMRCVFVRFLEEIENTKKSFQNYITFNKLITYLYFSEWKSFWYFGCIQGLNVPWIVVLKLVAISNNWRNRGMHFRSFLVWLGFFFCIIRSETIKMK